MPRGVAQLLAKRRRQSSINNCGLIVVACVHKRQTAWDARRREQRLAHIYFRCHERTRLLDDANAASTDIENTNMQRLSRECVAFNHVFGDAANAIAAHAPISAIGVEDTHRDIMRLGSFANQQQFVSTHAKLPIAQLARDFVPVPLE
jgi:hypothetical protein